MDFRNLGNSGLRVSSVGLGCNNFADRCDERAAERVIDAAIDHGITFFDTADCYGNRGGSEACIGHSLGARRAGIVLATKFGIPMDDAGTLSGGSRRYIMSAAEASLRRLRTDWIDLYQLHMPDPLTRIDETLRALEDLVSEGKVRYIGHCNLRPWQVVEAAWTARELRLAGFMSASVEYSLLARAPENEMLSVLERYGLGLLPYYPLASGLLTGKYKRGAAPAADMRLAKAPRFGTAYSDSWDRIERLTAFAEARGRTLLELAFSWLLHRPAVSSVIAGATSPEQVAQNVAAAGWQLSPDELHELDEITRAVD